MKILVTGANGFVGRELVPLLISSGHSVTGVIRNAETYSGIPIELIQSDIVSEKHWDEILRGHHAVIHLAARVHVMNETDTNARASYIKTNTDATLRLGEAARRAGTNKFIFLSSAKVYGEETLQRGFALQDARLTGDAYGDSKLLAELELHRLSENSGFSVRIIRAPLVFGSGVGGNFLSLLKLSALGIPLPLRSIKNRRSVVSVWNLCSAILQLLEFESGQDVTINVREERDPSTAELVTLVRRANGMKPRLFPFTPGFMELLGKVAGREQTVRRLTRSLVLQPESSHESFTWHPELPLSEGLIRTVKWYSSIHRQPPENNRFKLDD